MTFPFDAIFWAGFICLILGFIGGACLSYVVRQISPRRRHEWPRWTSYIAGASGAYVYDLDTDTWTAMPKAVSFALTKDEADDLIGVLRSYCEANPDMNAPKGAVCLRIMAQYFAAAGEPAPWRKDPSPPPTERP